SNGGCGARNWPFRLAVGRNVLPTDRWRESVMKRSSWLALAHRQAGFPDRVADELAASGARQYGPHEQPRRQRLPAYARLAPVTDCVDAVCRIRLQHDCRGDRLAAQRVRQGEGAGIDDRGVAFQKRIDFLGRHLDAAPVDLVFAAADETQFAGRIDFADV